MNQPQHKPLFTQSGIVEGGTEVARTIGFPTANIRFEQADISGTYAGIVVVDGVEYQSAVYANQVRHLLEAHLFNFSGDLYGKKITIRLLEKLLDVEKFRDSKDQKTFIDWAISEVQKYFDREG